MIQVINPKSDVDDLPRLCYTKERFLNHARGPRQYGCCCPEGSYR